MQRQHDVVVVGAGPVGLMFANLLGGYGVSVLVVDQLPSLIDYPRAVGMDDESLRTFQAAGLVDEVLPHTAPNQRMRFVNGKGKVLAQMLPSTLDFGWPRRNGFIQPLADQVLLEGLSSYPNVEVRWGTSFVDLAQDADGVDVTVSAEHGTETMRAAYVIGSDGGRSGTRKALGMEFEGKTSSTRWLVVDLASDPLGQPGAVIGADPKRPYVCVGLPHGVRRFEFMLFDDESEEMVDTPEFMAKLLDGKVHDPSRIEVIRRRVYTHSSRLVRDFRSGRVFLAGDAAHIMPVWQGQGYNSGIRDAANLAWKLAAVLRGQCDDTLLSSYDAERHGHARAMVDLSTLVGAWVSPTSRLVAGARDLFLGSLTRIPAVKSYLVEMRFKPMPVFTEGAVAPATSATKPSSVGRIFPQPRVDTREEADVLLDDVLGPWFSVLVWNNDPHTALSEQTRARLRELGARLVWLRPVRELGWRDRDRDDVLLVGDRAGRIQQWFQDADDSVIFLRPDRIVAGACPGQRADEMVADVLAALGATAAGSASSVGSVGSLGAAR